MRNRRAVFLDRDGTICEEGPPVRRFEDLRLFDDVIPVIQWITQLGYAVVVVTNQAAIARGILTVREVNAVHREMAGYFASRGAPVLAIRFCPHHPQGTVPAYAVRCSCRKPASGMLTEAADNFGIDLARSWLVGDNITDIQAGWNVGCHPVLVRTGHGRMFQSMVPHTVPVIDNLGDVARILSPAS